MLHTHTSKKSHEKGFTLLEVTFVITIFAIMASIVLFRFKDFGTKTSFDNLTQDIALNIVQAQKSAISGALNPNFAGTSNPPAYGVYFKTSVDSPESDPATHEFTYFTDIPTGGAAFGNKIYDVPTSGCPSSPIVGNECISTTSITSGEYVYQICGIDTSGVFNCDTSGSRSASITFIRPFPDATIALCDASGSCSISHSVYIELRSTINPSLVGTISVSSLGEVRVSGGPVCKIAGPAC